MEYSDEDADAADKVPALSFKAFLQYGLWFCLEFSLGIQFRQCNSGSDVDDDDEWEYR